MSKAPIDLNKLAVQTLNDLKTFKGEGLDNQILHLALYAAYQAGREHGEAHGWHERQEQDNFNVDLGGC